MNSKRHCSCNWHSQHHRVTLTVSLSDAVTAPYTPPPILLDLILVPTTYLGSCKDLDQGRGHRGDGAGRGRVELGRRDGQGTQIPKGESRRDRGVALGTEVGEKGVGVGGQDHTWGPVDSGGSEVK